MKWDRLNEIFDGDENIVKANLKILAKQIEVKDGEFIIKPNSEEVIDDPDLED